MNLKDIKKFEAVIMPKDVIYDGENVIATSDKLKKLCGDNDYIFMDSYEEFINSLGVEDAKNAPLKGTSPFIALFHPVLKKPTLVYYTDYKLPMSLFIGVMEHETIHQGQDQRSGGKYKLPTIEMSSSTIREYLSDKNEIMAFSYNIAKAIVDDYKDWDKVKNILKKFPNDIYLSDTMTNRFVHDIYVVFHNNRVIMNRYKKYIYLYCEKLTNPSESEE